MLTANNKQIGIYYQTHIMSSDDEDFKVKQCLLGIATSVGVGKKQSNFNLVWQNIGWVKV